MGVSNQKKSGGFLAFFSHAFFCLILLFSLEKSCFAAPAPLLEYSVLRTLPHDEKHFTQGLVWRNGKLFESAGGYLRSGFYEKSLTSGKPLRSLRLPSDYFAEGLTQLSGEFFLLSWRNGYGYVFDAAFRQKRRFKYEGEGWGLTDDGRQLIMSDGSSRLRWLDPATARVTRSVTVSDDGAPVSQLNELEYAKGFIYSNIWHSNRVALIAPDNGRVQAWLDLSVLHQNLRRPDGWDEQENVLNGIAYDAAADVFYVTGKCWPLLYELRVGAAKAPR